MKVVELEFSKSSQVKTLLSSLQTLLFCYFFGKLQIIANSTLRTRCFTRSIRWVWCRSINSCSRKYFRRFQFRIEQRVPFGSKQKFKAENSLGRFKFIILKTPEEKFIVQKYIWNVCGKWICTWKFICSIYSHL